MAKPTERERTQWYFQRYVSHLPAAGEIVLFDRSWYNRPVWKELWDFVLTRNIRSFYAAVPNLKECLPFRHYCNKNTGSRLVMKSRKKRFQDRINSPTKQWKLSPMDIEARSKWVEYSKAKDEMFAYTDIKQAPWLLWIPMTNARQG